MIRVVQCFFVSTVCLFVTSNCFSQDIARGIPEFEVRPDDEKTIGQWLEDGTISGRSCDLAFENVGDQPCLKVSTSSEFSDLLFDLKKLQQGTVDFRDAQFLTLSILIPKESWISAIKMNFANEDGDFGGIPEVANNYIGRFGTWVETTIDLRDVMEKANTWHGEGKPWTNATAFSLNPYNADQATPSVWYVRKISLSATKPSSSDNAEPALLKPLVLEDNSAFTINFDNPEQLRRWTAFRAFESSFQSLQKGIAGNETMSIRLKGSDKNKFIAFLPMFDKMTGKPLDFTKLTRIRFRYHLKKGSDKFPSMSLYVAGKHWQSLLFCKDFITDFNQGGWHTAEVKLADLKLNRVKGTADVLTQVYEIRLALEYEADNKDIEMWIDDFSWE
jgi:hypothetical protein